MGSRRWTALRRPPGCEEIHNMKRDPVGFVRKGGTTILQHDDSKVGVSSVSGRRLDDESSGHAH
jgi:hypothetical protein